MPSNGVCKDIDECASNPCKNLATCKDMVNGYTCICPEGYSGTHCETHMDVCDSPENKGFCEVRRRRGLGRREGEKGGSQREKKGETDRERERERGGGEREREREKAYALGVGGKSQRY